MPRHGQAVSIIGPFRRNGMPNVQLAKALGIDPIIYDNILYQMRDCQMRVTFDSNVWEQVVRPQAHLNSPQFTELQVVHDALRTGRISGFISETFATVEAIKRKARFEYLESRPLPIEVEWAPGDGGTLAGVLKIAADPAHHPGLLPVLRDRFTEALALDFKVLPSTRLGALRPPDLNREEIRIPLTAEQRENIWPLLDRIDEVAKAIEARGVGMAPLLAIAQRIQRRLGLTNVAWNDGLDQARDESEKREIADAFAEWADGDSIALHVGYGLDVFCTNDRAQAARSSIFDSGNRAWLSSTYGVRLMSLGELAREVAA